MIQPSQVVPVGTAVPGVVESISVERGDVVTHGQIVMQLRASVERASLAVARERATQMGETVVAKGTQELAQREPDLPNLLPVRNMDAQLIYQLDTVSMPPLLRQVFDRQVHDFKHNIVQTMVGKVRQWLQQNRERKNICSASPGAMVVCDVA